MDVAIVDDLSECEKLWKKFSPNKIIWDSWDVNFSFFNEDFEPYFIVVFDKKKEVGLLPLRFDKVKKEYCYFGGYFPEDREFWFDPSLFKLVFENIPKNTFLYDLNETSVNSIIEANPGFKDNFKFSDHHYFINLEKFNFDLEGYFKTFSKKHRKNLFYDLRKVKGKTKYELIFGGLENYDRLVELNVERFKGESDFEDKEFSNQFFSFLSYLEKEEMLFMVAILIDGKVEGIEFGCYFNDVYYVLNGGSNRDIENLGKVLIYEHFKKAISLKAKKIDFLTGDSGWKKLWNCETENYFNFEK